MERIKKIKRTSFIASIFFLAYILLILLALKYPYYPKFISYFDYLEEYEDSSFSFLSKDYEEDMNILVIPAFLSILLFSVSMLRAGAKRVLSRKGSCRVLIFSVILLIAEFISLFIISEKGSMYNEIYHVNVFILTVMLAIPVVGEIILAVSCAYEIMYCDIAIDDGERSSSTDKLGYRLFLALSVGFIIIIVILAIMLLFV
jgi:hypothetical protein